MSLTNYAENTILDEILGNGGGGGFPATVYIGVSSTAPAEDGTNITEPSGGAYARVAVTNNSTNWPAAASSEKKNGTVISFVEATAAWVGGSDLTHFVMWDAAAAGNALLFGALSVAKKIGAGDILRFSVDDLVVTAD